MQPVPSGGKHEASVKRGKTCNRCGQARDIARRNKARLVLASVGCTSLVQKTTCLLSSVNVKARKHITTFDSRLLKRRAGLRSKRKQDGRDTMGLFTSCTNSSMTNYLRFLTTFLLKLLISIMLTHALHLGQLFMFQKFELTMANSI